MYKLNNTLLIIKELLKKSPIINSILNSISNYRISRFSNNEELFTSYYLNNTWKNSESLSGEGSTVEFTKNIRVQLPILIANLGVKSILDAPCGDYNWFRFVERKDINYLGGDIVSLLVQRCQDLYGNENTNFKQIDIIKDRLPDSDLWLCRDCFIHFSDDDIFLVLKNFFKSNINYILTTTHPTMENNINIKTGEFRLINLEKPPFNFGKPLLLLNDGYEITKLGLWDKKQLHEAMSKINLKNSIVYNKN